MTQVNIWKNWRYHKLFKATACSIIFTITLTVVFVFANIIFPYPNIPTYPNNVSLKLKHFAEHKDEYDAIFIGPSTTYRGIKPNLFDKLMAEKNVKIKSFNLGFDGAIVTEINFYLEKIIALKPANLKWLFIEHNDLSIEKISNADSFRSIYWHTPKQTIIALRLILESRKPLQLKFYSAYGNLKSLLNRILWMGRLSNFWQEKILGFNLVELIKKPQSRLLIKKLGYYSTDWDKLFILGKQKFQNHLDVYYNKVDREIDKLKERNTASIDFYKNHSLKVLKNMCDRIEEQGIKPIIFISPIVGFDELTAIELYKRRNTSIVFALNNPEAFPTLYQVDSRWDFGHLNDRGAREFTRSMAEQFAKYLETQKSGIYPL
ncbi:hypothetical protein [Moorena sp. SIO3H5]|uniref:hypothetical protein n=1 Tax=Moorena sp. SIO3H5 TaxID=2607834 RepID=UPI0013BD0105|nr:hypothetical protein [Moorena sp. SIO3H5]NEO70512.1 hypothetical protein [Moorena sp. SIO3H5]